MTDKPVSQKKAANVAHIKSSRGRFVQKPQGRSGPPRKMEPIPFKLDLSTLATYVTAGEDEKLMLGWKASDLLHRREYGDVFICDVENPQSMVFALMQLIRSAIRADRGVLDA